MGYSNHKGTTGHTIGSQIIGKSGQPDSPKPTTGFSHMRVEPSNNGGFSVSHTPQTPKQESGQSSVGKPETPVEEQLHVFRSATEAHHHIGQLLGVRIGSGAQPV